MNIYDFKSLYAAITKKEDWQLHKLRDLLKEEVEDEKDVIPNLQHKIYIKIKNLLVCKTLSCKCEKINIKYNREEYEKSDAWINKLRCKKCKTLVSLGEKHDLTADD